MGVSVYFMLYNARVFVGCLGRRWCKVARDSCGTTLMLWVTTDGFEYTRQCEACLIECAVSGARAKLHVPSYIHNGEIADSTQPDEPLALIDHLCREMEMDWVITERVVVASIPSSKGYKGVALMNVELWSLDKRWKLLTSGHFAIVYPSNGTRRDCDIPAPRASLLRVGCMYSPIVREIFRLVERSNVTSRIEVHIKLQSCKAVSGTSPFVGPRLRPQVCTRNHDSLEQHFGFLSECRARGIREGFCFSTESIDAR